MQLGIGTDQGLCTWLGNLAFPGFCISLTWFLPLFHPCDEMFRGPARETWNSSASWNMNFSPNLHNFYGETNEGLVYFNSDCSSIMIRFHLLRMVGRWRPILAVHPASRPKGLVSQQSLRIANANVSLQLMQLNAALHNSTQFRQLSKKPFRNLHFQSCAGVQLGGRRGGEGGEGA